MHEDEGDQVPGGYNNQCTERSPVFQPPSPERILTVCCAPLDAMIKEGSLAPVTDKQTWILVDNKAGEFSVLFCPYCGRPLREVRSVEKVIG